MRKCVLNQIPFQKDTTLCISKFWKEKLISVSKISMEVESPCSKKKMHAS